jgi:hypothetical protein
MADWVENRVMVLGAADEVQSFFSFEDGSTPLLHLIPSFDTRPRASYRGEYHAYGTTAMHSFWST